MRREEVDAQRIGLSGISFGSFAGTIAAAHEPRLRACAVMNTCHQPGWTAAFEQAWPTYKMRFMYMSGHTDEDAFDAFARTLTWEGHAEQLSMPYLVLAGDRDELSPLECTEALLAAVPGPKQLVVYQDSRHSIGGVPAANLGPFAPTLAADWLADRVRGVPMASERWYVDHGVQIALLIDHRRQRGRDFRPGRPPRTLTPAETIDFSEVLRGFTWQLRDLFALLRLR